MISPMVSRWSQRTLSSCLIYPTLSIGVTNHFYLSIFQGAAGSMTQPQHGSYTIEQEGILYTPQPGSCGLDTFTYAVTHGNQSSMATVTINVKCPDNFNGASSSITTHLNLQDDEVQTTMNTAVSISVLDNDANVSSSECCKRMSMICFVCCFSHLQYVPISS